MKKIALTFDYELFLYQSGSIEHCIIKPVSEIFNALKRNNIHGVFFIDILYLDALHRHNLVQDYIVVKDNIQKLISNGHQVELHLHPHWKDAVFVANTNQWNLENQKNYRLHSLSDIELKETFSRGYNLLTAIGREVNETYKITAFRAGGLCLQPFHTIAPLLKERKIFIDSSVAPGLSVKSSTHEYNYINAPTQSCYYFSNDPMQIDPQGIFKEYPILNYQKNLLNKIVSKFSTKKEKQIDIYGDGIAASPYGQVTKKPSIVQKLKSDKYLFSLDGEFDHNLQLRKIKSCKNELITMISHPKLMTKNSLLFIDKLVKEGFEFITFAR